MRLKNADSFYFADAWNLYEKSFPENEKRTLKEQKIILNNDLYHAKAIIKDEKFIGILFYWVFCEYAFVEHFALDVYCQGKSYGTKILNEFLDKYENVVLEIEPIVDEKTEKRLRFYERLGFIVNEINHFQVPFRTGDEKLKLLFLSSKKEITQQEYAKLYKLMQSALTVDVV